MTTGSVDIVPFVINFPFSQAIYYYIIYIFLMIFKDDTIGSGSWIYG